MAGIGVTPPAPIRYAELETVYAKTLGGSCRSLALTAPDADSGVTTLAYSIAYRSAEAGNRTLLVELNMAHPCLETWLGIPRTNWEPGRDTANSAPVPVIDGVLDVLAAPRGAASSWSFREQAMLTTQIEAWLGRYDKLVVDTSPVNRMNWQNVPADVACGACQGTLLVAQPGRTTEAAVIEAVSRLRAAGAVIVGGVLNDRFMPRLADELCRETRRFERLIPGPMRRLRRAIRSSRLLNQDL